MFCYEKNCVFSSCHWYAFLFSSCIKEDMDDCVITHTVKVYVKDKNYSNIESVFQLVKKMKTYLIVLL